MAYSITETKQILTAVLEKDPATQSVGKQDVAVLMARGREADEATKRQPTVIFDFRGGPPRFIGAPVQNRSVHLYAYSNVSQAQADTLHEAATEAVTADGGLTHPRRDTDPDCPQQCVKVLETSGASFGWNNDVGAWFARSTLAVWAIG